MAIVAGAQALSLAGATEVWPQLLAGPDSKGRQPPSLPLWSLLFGNLPVLRLRPPCLLLCPPPGSHMPPSVLSSPCLLPQEARPPLQARLASRFCMAHLETISASNECFSFCPCPLKRLMNVFRAQVKQGGVSLCVCHRRSFGAVRLSRPAHRGGGSGGCSLATLAAHTKACRTLGAAGQIQEPGGLGGTLGLWAPGPLRMAGIWIPSSRNMGCEQERGSSFALTTLNMGIGHHTARPLETNFPPGSAPDPHHQPPVFQETSSRAPISVSLEYHCHPSYWEALKTAFFNFLFCIVVIQ